MVERKVQITHIEDHEFELATMVVQTAGRFNSVISIIMDNKRVNAKSIMGMMSLGLMEDRCEVQRGCFHIPPGCLWCH